MTQTDLLTYISHVSKLFRLFALGYQEKVEAFVSWYQHNQCIFSESVTNSEWRFGLKTLNCCRECKCSIS